MSTEESQVEVPSEAAPSSSRSFEDIKKSYQDRLKALHQKRVSYQLFSLIFRGNNLLIIFRVFWSYNNIILGGIPQIKPRTCCWRGPVEQITA